MAFLLNCVAVGSMLQKIYYLLENHLDFCVETTLATRSLLGIINEAKSRGYTINILYFWLSPFWLGHLPLI